ncbi:MAG TPA: copper ion binding protein [Spirochaetota bacterium]|nr:copper ion binding protein [Spirochaetota bacterium]
MEQERTLRITGMSCAACSARIEKALSRIEGVSAASVNLALETARVTYDTEKVRDEELVAAVEKAGYGAEMAREREGARVDLVLTGMSCAACAARIEKAVGRRDGVNAAQVNLSAGTARVL